MISAVVLFLSAISVANACVPTSVTTTTTPCCAMLSTSSLTRRTPLGVPAYHQCSVLHRVSSTCPEDGIIVCNAAADTNPTNMLIQLFGTAGTVVRSFQAPGQTLSAKVFCDNGVWVVRTVASDPNSIVPITQVSCSQTGSLGADTGYTIGTALD